MTEEELKNLLFKVSVQAIHQMSGGSGDPITVQESIERIGRFRPILGSVQILSVTHHSNSRKDLDFLLSPAYLIQNSDLVLRYGLDQVMWIFRLPEYDDCDSASEMDLVSKEVETRSDEGVVDWLSRGSVEIKQAGRSTYDVTAAELLQSVLRAQRP